MPCLHETKRTDYAYGMIIGRSVTDWDLQGQLPNFVIEPFPTKKGGGALSSATACRARAAEARASRGGKRVEGREEGGEERKEGRDSGARWR